MDRKTRAKHWHDYQNYLNSPIIIAPFFNRKMTFKEFRERNKETVNSSSIEVTAFDRLEESCADLSAELDRTDVSKLNLFKAALGIAASALLIVLEL